jgi:hypothetical protein
MKRSAEVHLDAIFAAASATIQDVVNASGSSAFLSHSQPVPDWWPMAAKSITSDIEAKMPEILDQRDIQKEKVQKSLRNRLFGIGVTVFWIFIGVVLDRLVGLLFATH